MKFIPTMYIISITIVITLGFVTLFESLNDENICITPSECKEQGIEAGQIWVFSTGHPFSNLETEEEIVEIKAGWVKSVIVKSHWKRQIGKNGFDTVYDFISIRKLKK